MKHLPWGIIAERMSGNGQALTVPRRQIIETMFAKPGPRTIDEWADLAQGPHRVTLYRIFPVLEQAGLIKRIRFEYDDAVRYELSDDLRTHHHHAVCEQCGLTEAVKTCRLETDPPKISGFRILRHQLEYYGLCRRCQGGA